MATNVRSMLTLVTVGSVDGATAIDCQPDSLRIIDLGLECVPHPIEPEFLEAVIDLVSDPEPGRIEANGQLSLLPDLATVTPDELVDEESLADPEFEILVRCLGDIRVEGGEPLAAKQTAVVAYIALHGEVGINKLEDAVWASAITTNRRKRLANTISECRAALGRQLFPPASDGRYRAGPGLVTDLEMFDRRIRRAAEQAPGEAADTLLTALGLVTGAPFTYRGGDRPSFAWVEVENWASTWELKVAAVAQRCTDLLLDLGRCEEAIEASMQALAAMPTHTGVTEALMRAHAANGDRLAVRRVYEEHLTALEALDLDAPDESTTDLFDQLVEARTA
jgi:DNA-binding SARP family transcriptional activator